MEATRTLLVSRKLSELGLTEEEIGHIKHLANRLDALGNLYARGYVVEPPGIYRQFINELRYFRDSLEFNGDKPKAWFARVHAVSNVQVRTSNERDTGKMVLVDLLKGLLRVRGFFYGRAIEVRLRDSELRYIRERLAEGGKAKFVQVWIDERERLNVAITFEREVVPIQSSGYALVVDVNSWRYGVVYAVVTPRTRVPKPQRVIPNLRLIDTTYERITMLERRLGKLKRLGLDKTPEGKKLRRKAKKLRHKLLAYLRDFVNKSVHELVHLALRLKAKIVVDYVLEESRRELLEEKLPSGLIKFYLAYLPRFVDLLETQARWYGIPIEFRRLYSTRCPRCGSELRHVGNRVMACDRCGFKANRDEIPLLWYIKKELRCINKNYAMNNNYKHW